MIDRKFLKDFTAYAVEVLGEEASKHGMKITYKGGNFARDGSLANIKFEILAPNESGEIESPEAKEFKSYATQYGFEPEDLGSEFTHRGETFRITGLKTRRPKFPISAERVRDGRGFKFPVDVVKRTGRPVLVEGLTEKIKSGFADLACQLSPENLTCDGELSAAQVSRRRATIKRQWAELERRAGQKVSESDTWNWK